MTDRPSPDRPAAPEPSGQPAASAAAGRPSGVKPVVLVPACQKMLGEHPFHVVGRKYVDAVRLAGCIPLVVPVAATDDLLPLLDLADGVLLTGSPSNVHPRHFGEPVHDGELPLDEERDAWTLPLVRLAFARGQPLLAICRGAQEANVALGGDLYQAVHETTGPDGGPRRDHRATPDRPAEEQYDLAHRADLVPGGHLARWIGRTTIEVNSLHSQAIRRLAPGLQLEATAPDGVVEGFSSPDPDRFFVAVQWHPEWRAATNAVSMRLLEAFGAACAQWRRGRQWATR